MFNNCLKKIKKLFEELYGNNICKNLFQYGFEYEFILPCKRMKKLKKFENYITKYPKTLRPHQITFLIHNGNIPKKKVIINKLII